MTQTRKKLDDIVNALPLVDSVKEEIKDLLDDLENEAYERGIQIEIDAHECARE